MDNSLLLPLESTIINEIEHSSTAEIVVKSGLRGSGVLVGGKKQRAKLVCSLRSQGVLEGLIDSGTLVFRDFFICWN